MTTEQATPLPDDEQHQPRRNLQERNDSLDRIAVAVDANTASLREAQVALSRRPTGREIEYRRRRGMAGLVVYAVLVIFAHDQHVEHCGPGSRAANPEPVSVLCDATFPLHGHNGPHPSPWALLGVAGYAGGGVAVWFWTRPPKRGDDTGD